MGESNMSEKIRNFMDKAKDMVESGELKDKAREAMESAKDKAEDIAETVKEKTAPVIDKVKDAATDAVDAVKEGVNRIATGDKPALTVKNELFDELGEKVVEQKAAMTEKAEEMQQKLEEMLGIRKPAEDEKAAEQKAAFAEKADELQQKLQELMNKDKD